MYHHAANFQFAKRAMMDMTNMVSDGETDEIQLPGWFWGVCAILFLVFLPVLLYILYTLNNLFPTLTMIEDPEPPAYEPLATSADGPEDPTLEAAAAAPPESAVPITSSLRLMHRLVHSIGGVRSNFRGFWCGLVTAIAMSALEGFFKALIPGRVFSDLVAMLPAMLLTLPLSTAWTHIAISQPKAVPWYKRLPGMKKTFNAMWRPTCIVWAAAMIATGVPRALFILLGLDSLVDGRNPPSGSQAIWKSVLVCIVGLVLSLGLVVPASVLFTRIQASLLPVEDEPILAFDRSFGGSVEPEVVGGKGYASLADAWKSFSKDSWWRLVKLYIKVLGISILSWIVIGVVFVSVFCVALSKAKRSDGSEPQ